jgi:ankyrin repeat protein
MSNAAQFIAAVQAGETDRVRGMLGENPSLAAARDEAGVSAVLHALYRRRTEILESLLAAEPALDVFEAAALGRVERLAELLAEDREQARAFSGDGFTALHLAAFFGQEAAARLLLERGADVRAVARNAMRVTPLNSAAATRQTSVVQLLVESGAPVNAPQRGGWTALHSAAHSGETEMARFLLSRGADPQLKSYDGRTALDLALADGHEAVATLLRKSSPVP